VFLAITVALCACNKVTPTCRSVCRKLARCDEVQAADYITTDECRDLCEVQDVYYERLEDDEELVENLEAWNSYKWCVVSETCEEVADGACYDEALFAF
jgi:hypothetical protein